MEGILLVTRHFFCLLSVLYLDQEEIKLCKKFIYSYSTRLAFHMPGPHHLTYYLLSRLVVPASEELKGEKMLTSNNAERIDKRLIVKNMMIMLKELIRQLDITTNTLFCKFL